MPCGGDEDTWGRTFSVNFQPDDEINNAAKGGGDKFLTEFAICLAAAMRTLGDVHFLSTFSRMMKSITPPKAAEINS